MKILLDNCVPYRVRVLLPGHEVIHASDIGFQDLKNGELMAQAATKFDVLMTTDKNIRYEHHLSALPLPVIELNTRFTRFDDLKTLAPYFEAALAATRDVKFVSIGPDGTLETLGERETV